MTSQLQPSLNDSDIALLAGLTVEANGNYRSMSELLQSVDRVSRWLPTYEEFGLGLRRLIDAGYATVDIAGPKGLLVAPTPRALELRNSAQHRGGDGSLDTEMVAEAHRYGIATSDVVEDRGMISGLTRSQFEDALREYDARLAETSWPWSVAARVIDLIGGMRRSR